MVRVSTALTPCPSPKGRGEIVGSAAYTTPWASIASATLTKPAMFAPRT